MNLLKRKKITFKRITEIVCKFYNIPQDKVIGCKRKKHLVRARQVIAYLMREKLNKSYPFIGRKLGNRDHTTALYAYYKIKKELEEDKKLKKEIDTIWGFIQQGQEINREKKNILTKEVFKKRKAVGIIKSLEDFPRQGFTSKEPHRQRDILEKYQDGWTLEEIGEKYKLTRERVRQIVENALLYNAREVIKHGIGLNLEEFLKEERRKHLVVMEERHGIFKKKVIPEKREKRWSRYYDCCRECGTTVIHHHSHGYCRKCYPKTRIFKEIQESSRLRNIERWESHVKEYSKEYSRRPEVVARRNKHWDLKYFGGNRERVILRDKERCQFCGLSREDSYKKYGKDLFVLHIGNKNDNRLENLITLCSKCFSSTVIKKANRK